ncbi:hypothetical protein CXF51_02525 [Bacillus subtilis subsp. subtilis]|nr:hypothetical protein CXF51_02525 [Bacillus subtilis subsp. subtilis]
MFFSLYRSDRGHTIKGATGAAIQVKEPFPLWLNISKPRLYSGYFIFVHYRFILSIRKNRTANSRAV